MSTYQIVDTCPLQNGLPLIIEFILVILGWVSEADVAFLLCLVPVQVSTPVTDILALTPVMISSDAGRTPQRGVGRQTDSHCSVLVADVCGVSTIGVESPQEVFQGCVSAGCRSF